MPGTLGLDNENLRVRQRVYDAWQRRDLESAAAHYREDTVYEDRRLGIATTVVGREAQLEHLEVAAGLVDAFRIEHSPIAVRGDRTSLARLTLSTRAAESPDVLIEMLIVGDLDEDARISRTIAFDVDDLAAAYEELDRLFVAGEGARFTDNVVLHSALLRALDSKQAEDLRPLLADDFVFVDHRPASFGELDADGWIAIQGELLALVDEQWTHAITFHVLTETAHIADVLNKGRTVDGSHFEIRFVGLRTVRDGKHTRIEVFPEGAVDAASKRLAELDA